MNACALGDRKESRRKVVQQSIRGWLCRSRLQQGALLSFAVLLGSFFYFVGNACILPAALLFSNHPSWTSLSLSLTVGADPPQKDRPRPVRFPIIRNKYASNCEREIPRTTHTPQHCERKLPSTAVSLSGWWYPVLRYPPACFRPRSCAMHTLALAAGKTEHVRSYGLRASP